MSRLAVALRDGCFWLYIILILALPSYQGGPWQWGPTLTLPWGGGATRQLGLLVLLPIMAVVLLVVTQGRREVDFRPPVRRVPVLLWPFAALTLLTIWGLRAASPSLWLIQGMAWASFWLVLIYVAGGSHFATAASTVSPKGGLVEGKESHLCDSIRPYSVACRLWYWVLVGVVAIQSIVAIIQFYTQSLVGLGVTATTVTAVSLLEVQGRPLLRAYGLTGHPNALGAFLAVALVLLISFFPHRQGATQRKTLTPQTILTIIVVGLGLLALVLSFSRAALLGLAVGLGALAVLWVRRNGWRRVVRPLAVVVPLALLLLWPYREIVASRWLDLTNRLEARSLFERTRDMRVAIQLITAKPGGVGTAQFVAAARQNDPAALIVHNVPLLVGAELGWLALLAVGVLDFIVLRDFRNPAWPAWVAWLVVASLDVILWPSTGLRGAVMLGLLAGVAIQSQSRPQPT